jgi:hypothetical protein
MELILEDDFKTLNNLKNYLKNNYQNIVKKKLLEANFESIFYESFYKSLKYTNKHDQILFFSKLIFEKMNEDDFCIAIYRYLRMI